MNIGALRTLCTLDSPNGSAGYLPLDPPEWWCAVSDNGSGQAMQLVGHPHPGITTATRVHFGGRTFHVDLITQRQEFVLTVREVFD